MIASMPAQKGARRPDPALAENLPLILPQNLPQHLRGTRSAIFHLLRDDIDDEDDAVQAEPVLKAPTVKAPRKTPPSRQMPHVAKGTSARFKPGAQSRAEQRPEGTADAASDIPPKAPEVQTAPQPAEPVSKPVQAEALPPMPQSPTQALRAALDQQQDALEAPEEAITAASVATSAAEIAPITHPAPADETPTAAPAPIQRLRIVARTGTPSAEVGQVAAPQRARKSAPKPDVMRFFEEDHFEFQSLEARSAALQAKLDEARMKAAS